MRFGLRSKTRSALLNIAFNYANVGFALVNGLLLVPLYFKYFSTSLYGSFLAANNVVAVMGLAEVGLSYALTQRLAVSAAKNDSDRFRRELGSGLVLAMSLAVVLVVLGAGLFELAPAIGKAEPINVNEIRLAFLLAVLAIAASAICTCLATAFQASLRVEETGTANCISSLLGIAVTLIALRRGAGVCAIPFGLLMKMLSGIALHAFALARILREGGNTSLVPDKAIVRELLLGAMSISGGTMVKGVASNCQVLLVAHLTQPAFAAIYFITGRVYWMCDSFLAPIGSSIFSSISQLSVSDNSRVLKSKIAHICYLFTAIASLLLAICAAMNPAFVRLLLGPNKFGGEVLSVLIAVSLFSYTRTNFIVVTLFALGVNARTAALEQIGIVLRILLIVALVKSTGYIAVPAAEFVASSLMGFVYVWYMLKRRLSLSPSDVMRILTGGMEITIMGVALVCGWIWCAPIASSWLQFVALGALFASILFGIAVMVAAPVRGGVLLVYRAMRRGTT